MSRLVAPSMRERGGRIINMSSDAAFVGDAGLCDYAAAKMGIVGFTRSLARELAAQGVTVNAVAPGAIRTRAHDRLMPAVIERIKATTPAGYIGDPEDVSGCVASLASADARYITGQTLLTRITHAVRRAAARRWRSRRGSVRLRSARTAVAQSAFPPPAAGLSA